MGKRKKIDWNESHNKIMAGVAKGLSVPKACRSAGVHPNQYYVARKRLKLNGHTDAGFTKFVPENSLGIKIQLPNGAVINVASGDAEALKTVLSTLNK